MQLSMFSPRDGVARVPWELDCQNSHFPREFDRRLAQEWDLTRRSLEVIMSKFEGTPRGFRTQNCFTWVGN